MSILTETPLNAARRLSQKFIQRGFTLEALHEYNNEAGKPLFYKIRLKNSKNGEKWIRPFSYIEHKGYEYGEPKFEGGKPIYNLYSITQQPESDVWICEGEWCVDVLTKIGILATTSGSAASANKADWSPLSNKKVIIWPDNDEAGLRYATNVAHELQQLGCELWQVDLEALSLPKKGDVVDWLKMNPTSPNKDVTTIPLFKLEPLFCEPEKEVLKEYNRQNQASVIINFALEHLEFFHDKNAVTYALDLTTKETRRLDSSQFRSWLTLNYYEISGQSARDQSITEAINTLNGIAQFKGVCKDVYLRVAQAEDAYYLDLAKFGQSRTVCIKKGGWTIINEPPVRFLRPSTMRSLPTPVGKGDLSKLWKIANIPENQRLLVIAWLIDCLRPDTPFPVLELVGEQGCAKSTTQMVLRRLIDPNGCDLRAAPKKVEDIYVSAGINWLVSYENISYLSPSMQDALCVVATGGGYSKRKFYTDADESIITVKRPVILNGISASITAQDLVDRTISIEMETTKERIESSEVWLFFEANYSQFLGSLLDIFAKALERLSYIKVPVAQSPRLIEFTRLGMAIAEVLGQDKSVFLEMFITNRQEAIARTIEASPVASALLEWFEKRTEQTISIPVKTLFAQVEILRPSSCENWPRSPKGFADALRRAAPALRQMGVECHSLGKTGSYVNWEIKRI
ncbi:hypothetical protein SDB03_14255 [Legionella pneumophila serogroup 1]